MYHHFSSCTFITVVEGVHRIRPYLTLDAISNSPFVSQANTGEFRRRI